MIIRELRSNDFEDFTETLKNLQPHNFISRAKFERLLKATAENPRHFVYVAEQDGTVVGTITFVVRITFLHGGNEAGYIEEVAVRNGYERQGIGRALVHHVKQEALRFGCYRITLICQDKRVRFYENCGFVRHNSHMRIDFH